MAQAHPSKNLRAPYCSSAIRAKAWPRVSAGPFETQNVTLEVTNNTNSSLFSASWANGPERQPRPHPGGQRLRHGRHHGQGALAGDADVENTTIVVELGSGPAKGNLTLDADGAYRYDPASNGGTRESFSVLQ
jgi:hypothetical protein